MKIKADEHGLTVSGRRARSLRFADIAQVASEKVDKVTYEELFLILGDLAGAAFVLGELDDGFAEAERALHERLPGFATDWRVLAEEAPAGLRKTIWQAAN